MPISPHLRRKLKETLGSDAGEDLAGVMDGVDTLRGDIAELRREVRDAMALMREEMSKLRSELLEAVRQVDVRLANTRADLLRWSFSFWVGAVLAIAALAGVLRWTS
jgi:hypothetical protein